MDAPVSQRLSQDVPTFQAKPSGFVEMVYGQPTRTLFLQGCSGDIRPNLPGQPYRCGDEADIRWTGRDLGCEVVRTADRTASVKNWPDDPRSIRSSVRPKL